MLTRGRSVGIVLVMVAASAQALAAQQLTYTGGISYAGGSYVFDTRTDAFYLSNGVRMTAGRIEVGASVPVIMQNGGVVTMVGSGVPLPTGGEGSGVVARRGRGTVGTRGKGAGTGVADSTTVVFDEGFSTKIGDPTFDASAEIISSFGAIRSVRLNGTAKAPLTGVDSGVGSGEWDFGAGASIVGAAGRVLLFVDGSYWWLGDLPDLELIDGVSYGVGASVPAFAGRGSLLLMVSGMSRTIESMEPPLSLAVSLGRSVGERGFVSGGLGVGLTESAPSLSAQIGWSTHN